jgi:hypothetical protein
MATDAGRKPLRPSQVTRREGRERWQFDREKNQIGIWRRLATNTREGIGVQIADAHVRKRLGLIERDKRSEANQGSRQYDACAVHRVLTTEAEIVPLHPGRAIAA